MKHLPMTTKVIPIAHGRKRLYLGADMLVGRSLYKIRQWQ